MLESATHFCRAGDGDAAFCDAIEGSAAALDSLQSRIGDDEVLRPANPGQLGSEEDNGSGVDE